MKSLCIECKTVLFFFNALSHCTRDVIYKADPEFIYFLEISDLQTYQCQCAFVYFYLFC